MKQLICAFLFLWLIVPSYGKKISHFDSIIQSAENGDVNAEIELGKKYTYGDIRYRDFSKAIILFQKAADQGSSEPIP